MAGSVLAAFRAIRLAHFSGAERASKRSKLFQS
jgi:hypothetical protein